MNEKTRNAIEDKITRGIDDIIEALYSIWEGQEEIQKEQELLKGRLRALEEKHPEPEQMELSLEPKDPYYTLSEIKAEARTLLHSDRFDVIDAYTGEYIYINERYKNEGTTLSYKLGTESYSFSKAYRSGGTTYAHKLGKRIYIKMRRR